MRVSLDALEESRGTGVSWKPASECGLPVSPWGELPGLKTSVCAVVCALLSDVADPRVEVARLAGAIDYKRHLAGVLTVRALRRATARALNQEA